MSSTRDFSSAVPVGYRSTKFSRYPSRVKTVPGTEGGRYFQKLGGGSPSSGDPGVVLPSPSFPFLFEPQIDKNEILGFEPGSHGGKS